MRPTGTHVVSPRRVVSVLEPAMLAAVGQFDPALANPCWRGISEDLRCLPAFHVLSPHQAGGKSLYAALTGHPSVVSKHNAHTQFWSGDHMTMDEYVASFGESAKRVRGDAAGRALIGDASEQTLTYYYAQNMRSHRRWSGLVPRCFEGCAGNHTDQGSPGFRACVGRCWQEGEAAQDEQARSLGLPGAEAITVPLFMRAAYGAAPPRLVVLLREPSERLHSAFWEYDQYKGRYGASPQGYTAFVEEQIGAFERCVSQQRSMVGAGAGRKAGAHGGSNSDGAVASASGGGPRVRTGLLDRAERRCALLFESLDYEQEQVFFHADQVLRGMYALYLEEWLALWPRDRVLVLLSEDWFESPRLVLAQITSFLGLPGDVASDDAIWRRMRAAETHRAPNGSARAVPEAAQRRAGEFFAPYNRRLGRLLGIGDRSPWDRRPRFLGKYHAGELQPA